MKTIEKSGWSLLVMIAAVLMMSVSLTACSDDDDDDNGGSSRAVYVGVWASLDEIEGGYSRPFAIKLNDDGSGMDGYWDTAASRFVGSSEVWTWSVKGDVIMLTESDGEVGEPFRFILSDNDQIGTIYDGEDVYRYIRMQ